MSSIPLPGSERVVHRGAKPTGPRSPDERFEVTVVLRHNPSAEATAARRDAAKAADAGKHLSHEAFAASHAASTDDIQALTTFAQANGLAIVRSSPERRSVILSGTVAQFQKAFGVALANYEHADGTYRGREGAIQIPDTLKDIVTAVLGLDDRPQARTRLRPLATLPNYTPDQVGRLYNFLSGATGAGQCVALIELGGGFRPADLAAYFKQLGFPTTPTVRAITVDGGANAPTGNPNGADGEVMLDIEVVGAVAPGATIAVYFAPNTDRGFLDAITKALHDTHFNPSVISISWGGPQSNWTSQAMNAFDAAFQDAAVLGVTVCAAAGDNGSSDGVAGAKAVVDFPASSPNALACGGTRLVGSGRTITSETVWNDAPDSATGGGVSDHFGLPGYQNDAGVPSSPNTGAHGRGVPDVAGDADPSTGYQVRVDGTDTVIGGTSAVAPLWAGYVALCNEMKGRRAGFVNPKILTASAARTFHDILKGSNGTFHAGPGWDACTGLGSPNGTALFPFL